MGRKSLDATKVLRSLMVRADDDFFWLADDAELFFFLPAEVEPLCFLFAGDDESWAGNGLLCSNNSAARLKAVTRLKGFTGCSVTRLDSGIGVNAHCSLRYRLIESGGAARTKLKQQ